VMVVGDYICHNDHEVCDHSLFDHTDHIDLHNGEVHGNLISQNQPLRSFMGPRY
jgi:hypothetical protein